MNLDNDKRVVLTLDAGGTNFVFSAIKAGKEIVDPIRLPSYGDNLQQCLDCITEGFTKVKNNLEEEPVAISFAFPGPADYPKGIIGDLGNLPGFRGGVPLGPFLQDKFNLPVFINNDGDLYAYGEAMYGFLPYINNLLEKAGSPKRYKNLLGVTLGTGFGGGIVRNGELFIGDNSAASEVWLLRNKKHPEMNAEEGVSIRAIQKTYAERTGIVSPEVLTPKDIYEIGIGQQEGNKGAAVESFGKMAEVLGDALANVATVIDGLIVIGGGLSKASSLFLDKVIDEMNSSYKNFMGKEYSRLVAKSFNLEDEESLNSFLTGQVKEVTIPGSERKISYDPLPRIGVGISKIGTSRAVALGAYAYALNKISK